MTEALTDPYKDGGFFIIGAECFADAEKTVISWQGDTFYKAGGHKVAELEDGGETHCVKRVGHPTFRHEDFDGNTYDEVHGTEPDKIQIDIPTIGVGEGGIPLQINKLDIRKAWDAFVKPIQDAKEPMTEETRTVAAVLRTINEALPTVPLQGGN